MAAQWRYHCVQATGALVGGQEKVIGILVEAKKEGKRIESPILATLGSTALPFWITPLSSNGRGQARTAVSGAAFYWLWWRCPWRVPVREFICILK